MYRVIQQACPPLFFSAVVQNMIFGFFKYIRTQAPYFKMIHIPCNAVKDSPAYLHTYDFFKLEPPLFYTVNYLPETFLTYQNSYEYISSNSTLQCT